MSILQEGSDGKYTVTVPKPFVIAKNWRKGDDIGFAIVDELNRPQPGDIFLRRNAQR
jgi:bifunctional DNA-binding transcriptional regulator/antitoxin component of YhaV-PrlF toxin-antitoxin module